MPISFKSSPDSISLRIQNYTIKTKTKTNSLNSQSQFVLFQEWALDQIDQPSLEHLLGLEKTLSHQEQSVVVTVDNYHWREKEREGDNTVENSTLAVLAVVKLTVPLHC